MTQLERLKIRITETTNDRELEDILESAKAVILSRRFPFGETPLEIEDKYLTIEKCNSLFKVRETLKTKGSNLKIKDGKFWEIEEVLAVSSKLDELVNKIKTSTVEEDGKKRPLNELEKFLWIYSFVANRKFQGNELDPASPRRITSIFQTGDCVCAGFANILKELMDKYQKVYGPLTINYPCNKWRWLEEPWPWERGNF